MSHQINELTLHVSDLEYTKEDLLNKVHILETQLSCVMTSHSETCSFSEECLNRGTLTPVSATEYTSLVQSWQIETLRLYHIC